MTLSGRLRSVFQVYLYSVAQIGPNNSLAQVNNIGARKHSPVLPYLIL